MPEKKSYLFGPVPSRRLGLSLGVDIVPFKTCTLDCLYCQLGRTTHKTCQRENFVPIADVLAELKKRIKQGLTADYITLSGSGEPTLHNRFGELIEAIKKLTDIPVAIITNATLLHEKKVRTDCAKADLIVPSLDAPDEQTFKKINRPAADITIDKLIEGMIQLRKEYKGQIWLEIFFIDSINTSQDKIEKFAELIRRIDPDKVQLNTAVRPTAEFGIKKINPEKMRKISQKLGKKCEIIADFSQKLTKIRSNSTEKAVLAMLKRRPCSVDDISAGLAIHRNEALKYIAELLKTGAIEAKEKAGKTFYNAI